MKNLVLILSLSFLFSFNASAQEEQINVEAIDNYKYVIIPLQYDFLSKEDLYQINSLTKFLFNKYGYTAFLENESLPEDLTQNKCSALKADVVKVKGGFLKTNLKINLMDCNGIVVVSSKLGVTKEKEYKVAYNYALRGAFETFQFHQYNYNPVSKVVVSESSVSNAASKSNDEETKIAQEEIERLKQEVAALKEKKKVKRDVIKAVVSTTPKNDVEKNTIKAVVATSTIEEQQVEDTKKPIEDSNVLYAQPIDNGFQVVDITPKVVMILLETPKSNMFIVKDQNAIVYKEDGFWYLSKNDGKSTSLETLNIKF